MNHFSFTHTLEIPAVLTGFLNIYLAARANIWNWFFGILTISLYIFIFYHTKLYADASLYVLFLALQFYGAYEWLQGGKHHSPLLVSKADKIIYVIVLIATIILFFTIAYILRHYTDSTTVYIDAFTTAISLVAQWMMTKKWIENWWLWMLVDVVAIKMYFIKELYFSMGLYAVFFVICVIGYLTWKKLLNNNLAQGSC